MWSTKIEFQAIPSLSTDAMEHAVHKRGVS